MAIPSPLSGTDHRQENPKGPAPAVILIETQLGENIGTAARAMANFGLHELRGRDLPTRRFTD